MSNIPNTSTVYLEVSADTDTKEQKLIDISKKVAAATHMSWQEVRRILQQFLDKNDVDEILAQVQRDVEKLNELIKKCNQSSRPIRKGYRGCFTDSPDRRELVTRFGPKVLIKSTKTQRRRFRNIRRKCKGVRNYAGSKDSKS